MEGTSNTFDRIKSCPKSDMARSAGKFVKHVLPAAFKPIHSLWHEILGFIFLVFAAVAAWGIIRHTSTLTPGRLFILVVFIVVMVVYGVSSFLKVPPHFPLLTHGTALQAG